MFLPCYELALQFVSAYQILDTTFVRIYHKFHP